MAKIILLICSMVIATSSVVAQRVTVSTDAVRLALAVPNVVTEVLVSRHMTLGVDLTIKPFEGGYAGLSSTIVAISPELRYYFKRPGYAHFIGANLNSSIYDVTYCDDGYKGKMLGTGVVYGYSFYLCKRWSLTPAIGIGISYQKYNPISNGVQQPLESGFKPAITRLGVALSYIIN